MVLLTRPVGIPSGKGLSKGVLRDLRRNSFRKVVSAVHQPCEGFEPSEGLRLLWLQGSCSATDTDSPSKKRAPEREK